MLLETSEGWVVKGCFPDAETVHLLGEFNHWSTTATPMQRHMRGIWQVTLRDKPRLEESAFLVHVPGRVGGRIHGAAQTAA